MAASLVATRIVLVVDFFAVIFALGADWLIVGTPGFGSNSFLLFDVYTMLGGYIGGQLGQTCVQTHLSPLVLGSWEADVALIAVPLAAVLGALAFSRWKLSFYAGVLMIVAALLWSSGIAGIAQDAAARLVACPDVAVNGNTLETTLGPYIAVAAGVLLLATYFLTEWEKLDPPVESAPPTRNGGSNSANSRSIPTS